MWREAEHVPSPTCRSDRADSMRTRRLEPWTIGLVAVLLTVVPAAVSEWPGTPRGLASLTCAVIAGLLLAPWRRHPIVATVGGGGLMLVAGALSVDLPNPTLLICSALALLAGQGFGGRSAWTSAAAVLAWLVAMYLFTGDRDAGLIIFTVPGFFAGTALRLRRETAEEFALRGQELAAERELLARLAVRNERARIAAELHDVIGHSLRVMVMQAAAGQRLLQQDSEIARLAGTEALTVVAESARQGRDDLARLMGLLRGQELASPDLEVMDEGQCCVDRSPSSGRSLV
jgi:signal transduction histidine kinase